MNRVLLALGIGATFSCAAVAATLTRKPVAPKFIPLKIGATKASATKASTTKTAGQTASATTSVTFNKDIAPILFDNCSSCHRAGEVAPFPLLTYRDAQKRAKQIAIVTQSRFMPPWKADEGREKFHDARRLSDTQIQTIAKWAENGAPEGKAADLPPAPRFDGNWSLGKPDATFQPDIEYSLSAEGDDVYRNFVVPTSYAEDRWVSAMEVRPGNRGVVHHVIVYLDTSGEARRKDAADDGPGYTSSGSVELSVAGSLGGWAPGNLPRLLPSGVGMFLPKGADLVLQVHYHRSGKPETDQTKIGLYFAKEPVQKKVRILPILSWKLDIPPGEKKYEAKADFFVPFDATVLRVMPHMHLLGRDMIVTATLPDGQKKKLVNVPDWDFNWQTTYSLKEPLKLPRGSKLEMVAHYDNSADN
ncbi:MAG TPA: hypothetical protein VM821_04995, partial [Abditibacteriaceae bacterium]|nr:hypothetical protein [Abditibacteriaceae bacterium]